MTDVHLQDVLFHKLLITICHDYGMHLQIKVKNHKKLNAFHNSFEKR